MNESLYHSVLLYKTTMALVKNMLRKGLISAEEYAEIETKTAKKYGLELSVIYR